MSSIATGNEPRFDVDYEYGHQGELFVTETIDALKNNRVEVKRKRYQDDRFYVEYECKRRGQWRPSGIQTTKAELWAFVIGDSSVVVIIPTLQLREAARREWLANPDSRREETHGSHPTRGVLVSFAALIRKAA